MSGSGNFRTVPGISTYSERVEQFAGLDRRVRPAANALTDCMNVETGQFPALSVREPRLRLDIPDVYPGDDVTGLCYNGECLCFFRRHVETEVEEDGTQVETEDNLLYVGGQEFPLRGNGERHLVFFSAYVLVFPDGIWVNTAEKDEDGVYKHGNWNDKVNVTRIRLCDAKGTVIEPTFTGRYRDKNQPVPEAEAGSDVYWLAVKDRVYYLYKWLWNKVTETEEEPEESGETPETGAWDIVSACYERFELEEGSDDPFLRVGNLIDISGLGSGYDGLNEVKGVGDGYLIIQARDVIIAETIQTCRYGYKVPQMDAVVASGARLFGCRYGETDGENVNVIYGSAPGSFVQWFRMQEVDGVQSAANALFFSVSVPGPFTGAVSYGGNALFFKRNALMTVYGSESGGYACDTVMTVGVQPGSERSLTVLNGVLYYKSMAAFYAYSGGEPVMISGALGGDYQDGAVCGGYGEKLYACVRRNAGERELLIYDTARGMWTRREAPKDADSFCGIGTGVIYRDGSILWIDGSAEGNRGVLTAAAGGDAYILTEEGCDELGQTEDIVPWYAEMAPVGYAGDSRRYILRIMLNMKLDVTSRVTVELRYDNNREWEPVYELSGERMKSYDLPVMPRRCSTVQLRLRGEGSCIVYSMTRVYKDGGSKV